MHRDLIELLVAIGLAILSILGFIEALGFPRASAYLPAATMGAAAVLSVVWAVRSLLCLRRNPTTVDINRSHMYRVAVITVVTVAYLLSLTVAGFFTATFVFIAVAAILLGLRRVRVVIFSAAAFTVGLYLVFSVFLQRPFPREFLLETATRLF